MVDGDDSRYFKLQFIVGSRCYIKLRRSSRHDKLLILHFSISCERARYIFTISREYVYKKKEQKETPFM